MKAASKRQSFYKVILPATGAIYCLSNAYSTTPAVAQSIIAAPDGTATLVTPNGNRIDISGGTLSGNGGNLFHSFGQFGLKEGEIANFLSNPAIQNILARVVNGHPCIINGLIQVTGGNSNLFLANPAGIVFGGGARLNVPAAFTATTANGIGIGTGWFNASGNNNYAALVGTPSAFAFTMNQPGAIINSGDLAVKEGQSLVLLGGTVVNSGKLSAPGGQLLVSAMPGESVLRISQPGHLLSLEVEKPNSWTLPILSLPQLLTGGGATNANTLQANSDGTVQLIGSGIKVEAGDAVIVNSSSHAGTATITAVRNLALVESQLFTTGDMNLVAANTVQIRDSVAQPFSAKAGGNLYVQGNQAIDILALNHLAKGTPFQSGGAMTFVSNGNISGDSHFASVGPFSMLNLAGGPGNFISWYDPIISSESDVSLGDYTGASLKIETLGSITAGNITITTPDTMLSGTDPDIAILTSSPALILRAGVAKLVNPVSTPIVNAGGTDIKTLTYNATNLGVLDGTTNSKATSINDSGQVVGASYNTNLDRRAFLYSNGTMTPIGILPGDTYSQATAINSSGQIAGYSGGKVERAFLYSDGTMTNLSTLVGGTGGYSQAYGLNSSGQVVGESTNAGPNSPRAFIYSGGTMKDLGALPGGTYSRAYGINDSGQIVGRSSSPGGDRAYIYSNGTMQDLGTLAGGTTSLAYAINQSGQAAGISGSAGGDRAVLYSNGTITNLGVLPGDVKSAASGINNLGEVVGESRNSSGNPGRAILYTNGTMTDLNLLINPGSGLDKLTNAQVINDKGQIAGTAMIGSQFRAFRADRVTTPGGGITVGNISTAGGPVILQAPKINVTGSSIASNGGAINIDGPLLLNSTTGAVNVNSGGGSIAFNQSVNGAQTLTVEAGTGNIDFKGAVGDTAALASLSINSGKEINVGSINATGTVGIKVSGNIQTGDLKSNGLSLSSSGGTVTIPGNITSTGGALLFQGLQINIRSSSIVSNGGAITFDGATQLASITGAVNINSGDGDISFKSTLDGKQDLTLSSGKGNITFNGAIGSINPLDDFIVSESKDFFAGIFNTSGTVSVKASGNIQAGDIKSNGLNFVTSGGEINLPGNISSLGGPLLFQGTKINITSSSIVSNGGAIAFDGPTFLNSSTGAVTISSGNGDIAFKNTLDGNQDLSLSAGTGNIAFQGIVGSTKALDNLTVSSAKDVGAADITTTGKVEITDSGNINTGNISASLGITLTSTEGNINTRNLNSSSGSDSAIALSSKKGTVTGDINSAGKVQITDSGNINTGNIAANEEINLKSTGGSISTINLTSNSNLDSAIALSSQKGTVTGDINSTGKVEITDSGNINTGNISASLGISLTSNEGNINTINLKSSSGSDSAIALSSQKGTLTGDITSAGKVEIIDIGNINTGNIAANGGINLKSTDGNINTRNLNSSSSQDSGAAIALSSQKGTVTGDINSAGKVEIIDIGNINTGNIAASLGITLTSTEGNINTINLKSSSGSDSAIALSSQKGTVTGDINSAGKVEIIDIGNINTGNIAANGGINLKSTDGNINTRNLNSSSSQDSGAAIALSSEKGSVTSGDITSTGNLSGGEITVVSKLGIAAGQIDSSQTGVAPADAEGKAGNVTLKSDKNIVVGYINAQGGSVGTGGKVDITTAEFFQANSTLTDQNGIEASISTAGGKEGGEIFIRHGGKGTTPFQVQMSDRSTTPPNGTVGAITSGSDRKISNQSFQHSYTLGNIHIITESAPPPPPPPPPNRALPPSARPIVQPTPMPLPPVTLRLSDAPVLQVEENPSVSDRNPEAEQSDAPSEDNRSFSANAPTALQPRSLPPNSSKTSVTLPDAELDSLVAAMEEPLTRQFEQHAGKTSSTRIATLATVQSSLSRIQTVTQIKPAIVYIVFAPATTASRSASKSLMRSSSPKTVPSMFGEEANFPELASNQRAIAQSTTQAKRPNRDKENLELVIVTSSGKPIRKQLLVTRQEVLKAANQLRSEITKISRKDNYLTSSRKLYKWLIEPIEADLNSLNIQNLVFVMDSGLRSVPIAALHDGQKFLVEKYSVGLMPSLSLTDTTYVDIKKAAVLAMGASVFPAAQRQKPLPAVPIELATITEELRQGKFFLNEAFTLENLKAQRQQKPAQIVHLATHGEFNSGAISQSYIQLWDTKLRLDQIRQLGLHNPPVELLVLSACRSALGNEDAELGFAGLAVQAGVKSAIASLWYVSDEGTFGLMTDFYQKLQKAPIKAEALRQAQVAMLKGEVRLQKGYLVTSSGNVPLSPELAKLGNKDLSHPYYWAAFTMIGNPW